MARRSESRDNCDSGRRTVLRKATWAAPTLDSHTLGNLSLVDMQTYQVIDALAPDGTLDSYTFTMKGETIRHFIWVLGPVNASHFAPGGQTMRYLQKKKRELTHEPPTKETEAPANNGFSLLPD